MVKFSKFDGSL